MSTTASTLSREQAAEWIAPARLSPYLAAADGEHQAAVALYVWHARVSGACSEVIHYIEVLVRNAMHRCLKGTQPEDGLHSWLVDPDVLGPPELTAVANVVTRIRRRRRPVTEDRVIAGLPLSFWARVLGTNYDELWAGRLHAAFPHGSGLRRDAAGQLNRVSQLRNELAHHKTVLHVAIADRHDDMLALAAAVDPAAAAWIGALSRVEETLAERPG
jgi:hypothetical protein